jgi:hypothetical protein
MLAHSIAPLNSTTSLAKIGRLTGLAIKKGQVFFSNSYLFFSLLANKAKYNRCNLISGMWAICSH